MNQRQRLDDISGKLFFAGLFISRFNKINLPFISSGCFILSALSYLGGYVAWLMSVNDVHASRPHIADELKAQFEREYLHTNQYFYAAMLGIAASAALAASLFMPVTLGLASCWLFLGSNAFWWWAEHMTINRLREDIPDTAALNAREKYYIYTTLVTLNSAIIALSLSLYFVIPALTVPLGLVISTFLIALNIHTFHYWLKSGHANAALSEDEQEIDAIELSLSHTKLLSRNDFSACIEESSAINLTTNATTQETDNLKIDHNITPNATLNEAACVSGELGCLSHPFF